MKYLTIKAYNNFQKLFKVPYQPGSNILETVNENVVNPKKEGIPFICLKGACRGCTIEIIEGSDLLEPPSKLEQRALQVGKTTIAKGYRLACKTNFKEN